MIELDLFSALGSRRKVAKLNVQAYDLQLNKVVKLRKRLTAKLRCRYALTVKELGSSHQMMILCQFCEGESLVCSSYKTLKPY